MHAWADLFLIEIIDPKTGEAIGDDEQGELVVTSLSKEALPLIRYRIGDLTILNSEVCECGRTHPRLMRIQGRVDDMLIIRGINVFPSQVESVLMHVPELGDSYQLIVDRVHELDTMKVRVEAAEGKVSSETNELVALKKKIAHMLRRTLGIDVDVEFAEPGTIPRSMGKAKRVVDNRRL